MITPRHRPRGALIAFEGIDRCGKSTQAALAADTLTAAGVPCVVRAFSGSGGRASRGRAPAVEHLAAASERLAARASLVHALESGVSVLLDGYTESGAARTLAGGICPPLDGAWCRQADAGAVVPDLVVLLDCDASVALARAPGEGGEGDEGDLSRVAHRLAAARRPSWLLVDAARERADVHARVMEGLVPAVNRARAGLATWRRGP